MPLQLKSRVFRHHDTIPARCTADGRNLSPALIWSAVPQEACELALIVEDPDAPGNQPWVHWVIYGIPARATGLPEGVPPGATPSEPPGALQGMNSWGTLGYGGPAPPVGDRAHRYHFMLFALDAPTNALHSLTASQLRQALRGHVIDEGELVGTYSR